MKAFKSFDIFGNIAVLKFPSGVNISDRKKYAEKILAQNSGIKTVLEKIGKFKGRLRKMETRYLAGEKTKEVLYKENNCVFRFNIDKTYFSPRLSNERKEISKLVKKNDKVLVMFAGVGPFSIVIAKNCKNCKVWSNEINKDANKYEKLNVELNNLKDKVELLPGDIKKVVGKNKIDFDVIVMPRPQLKDSFLKEAFLFSKKGTRIFYYDFCKHDEVDKILEKIKTEAKLAGKKIKILRSKKAGEVGPYKLRLRVDFVVN